MTKKLLMLFVLLQASLGFAQTGSITGTVTDAEGIGLPGVNIVEKGTQNGVVSDFDGNFTIVTNSNATLMFSYLGFVTKEVSVAGKTSIKISLEEDLAQLDEVVVIGYGTVKKSDLTGSVATVDTEKAYIAPVTNLENAIQGRASGVQVTSSNGAPGASSSILIRGGNSISAGNEPLYVVDGFVGIENLSSINPNDIETMQVLKDASSTAIYGARGSNGVVVITTKKGKIGKPVVNFRASTGIQVLPEKLDILSGSEYAEFINRVDTDLSNGVLFDLNNLPGEETDWQDVMIRSAIVTDYQLSLSGGTENTKYYMSAGYLSQDGIVRGSGFERFSLRSNIDTRISKVFKAGVNLSLSETVSDNNAVEFRNLVREDPLKPVFDDEGNFNVEINSGVNNSTANPLATNELNTNETTRDRIIINTYIEAALGDKVTLKSTFGGDFLFSKLHTFTPASNPSNILNQTLASGRINRFNDRQLLNENTINYSDTFGDHSFSILGGVTAQNQQRETVTVNQSDIPSDGVGINNLGLAPIASASITTAYSEWSLFSLLSRVNYSYRNKYLFTASVRRDGSSRLGNNERFAVFPSAAISWKISEEPFIQNVDFISNLKLRASAGVTGNQSIPIYSTQPTFTTRNGNNDIVSVLGGATFAGIQQDNISAPNTKWESTTQYDVGLEFSLFNNRFSGEVDFYHKTTDDLLLTVQPASFTGVGSGIQNVGSIQNQGIDLSLTAQIVRNKNFTWNATLNINTFKNEVLELGNSDFISTRALPNSGNDDSSRLIVGQPVGVFWGRRSLGIDPASGDHIWADISGPDGVPDGEISDEFDREIIGDPNPDFYGGFITDFTYKNFDFSTFFSFSYGNENYNEELIWGNEVQVNSFSALRDNIWTASNTENASYPGVESGTSLQSNSTYVQDASYLRLTTMQLGYTLPSNTFKNNSTKCRLYITGTNLFLVKDNDYLGFDPDVNTSANETGDFSSTLRGFDRIAYPQNRSFLLGIDITF